MAEDANGAVNRQSESNAPAAADRALSERRTDIAKARGRVSVALSELEDRARQPFRSIVNAGRRPADSGFVALVTATSGLVARCRSIAPLFLTHRRLTAGAVAAAMGIAIVGAIRAHRLYHRY